MYDADKHTTPRRPWSLRKKLLIFTPLIITVLALALGLGLGLTIGRNNDDDNNNDDEDAPPLPSPTTRLPWTPSINSTWQIVLQNRISLPTSASSITPDVDVYDVDLFETDKDTIATLHRLGKKVICYFSGGSYEPGRPDSGDFAQGDLGDALDGWPDERWVRLGSEGIRGIMKGRVELAHEKGCDGVDPDNVDGFVSVLFPSLTFFFLFLSIPPRRWDGCLFVWLTVMMMCEPTAKFERAGLDGAKLH